MRTEIGAKELLGMIREARTAIPSVPDGPVAAAVEIRVEDDSTRLTGSGPGGTVQAFTTASGEREEGSILVSPRPLESFLKSLGTRKVLIRSEDGQLVVSCDSMQDYHFRGVPGDLPEPGLHWGDAQRLDGGLLAAAIAAVKRSADMDGHAVQIRVRDRQLLLETTDNYRLSQALSGQVEHEDLSIVVSIGDLEAAGRSGVDSISFSSDLKAVQLSGEGVIRSVRSLSRPFPLLDSLIGREMPHAVSVDAEELADALRRLQSVVQGRPVDLRLGPVLEILGENPDVGSGREQVSSEGDGEEVEMSIRAEYLLDVAESCRGRVLIQYTSESAAVRFRDEHSTHVVMPIRRA